MTNTDSYNLETGQAGLTGSCAVVLPSQQQPGFETGTGAFVSPCPSYTPSTNAPGGPGPVLGCTDPTASNYNALATFNDGSCVYNGTAPPLTMPFDFAVLRIAWGPTNGRDLDTRTAIIDPPRNVDVGWARGNTDGAFLTWGGDNTTPTGDEAVLIDFKALGLAYPAQTSFTLRSREFWFGPGYDPTAVPGRDGRFTIEFATYLGGTMQQSGYDFINVGGTLQNDVFLPRQSYTNSVGANVDGDDMMTLVYNSNTKLATIVPAAAPPMPPALGVASAINSRSGLTTRSPAVKS